jgi:hypothetical protein
VRRGLGLGPNPFIHLKYVDSHSNKTFESYVIKNKVGGLVAWPCQVSSPTSGGRGFDSCGVHKFFPTQTNRGVPHGTIPLAQKYAMCQNITHPPVNHQLPSQHANVSTMSLYDRTTYTVNCHISTVWTIQSTKNLSIWKNKQSTISFAYGVRLSPFKLCWVCNDEAYTHIYFEEILRTLILGLLGPILVPRSILDHASPLRPFGPLKGY